MAKGPQKYGARGTTAFYLFGALKFAAALVCPLKEGLDRRGTLSPTPHTPFLGSSSSISASPSPSCGQGGGGPFFWTRGPFEILRHRRPEKPFFYKRASCIGLLASGRPALFATLPPSST